MRSASLVRVACVAAALVSAGALGEEARPGPRPPVELDWALRLAKDGEPVAYRGVVDSNAAGLGTQGQGMLYPAPNVVGFLAAVVTHGILVESMKSSQKSKLQEDADRVLEPYRAALAGFMAKDLMREGLGQSRAGRSRRAVESAENPSTAWVVESASVFSLTQDRRAIILESGFSMYAPQSATVPARQVIVRVISDPRPEGEPVAYWGDRDGANLRRESARLYAEALDLAVTEAVGGTGSESRHRTVRYREGGSERMERAQLLVERCGRIVMRTLRGAVFSVPVASTPGQGGCESPTPATQ
jgi:hypothetical protein